MGEAKNREASGEASNRKFHMFKREQFLLLMHVLSKPSKDREERRKRKHTWEELKLVGASRKVVELGPRAPKEGDKVGLDPYDWGDTTTPIPVRISGGVMDFMIEKLAGELQGPAEIHLGDLEDRLVSLRDATYKPPAGLFPEDAPTEAPPEVAPAA